MCESLTGDNINLGHDMVWVFLIVACINVYHVSDILLCFIFVIDYE